MNKFILSAAVAVLTFSPVAASAHCRDGSTALEARALFRDAEARPSAAMERLSVWRPSVAPNARVMEVRTLVNQGRMADAQRIARETTAQLMQLPNLSDDETAAAVRQACRTGDTIVVPATEIMLIAGLCDLSRQAIPANGGVVCALRPVPR